MDKMLFDGAAFAKAILAKMRREKLSYRGLKQIVRVPYSTLHRITHQKCTPNVEIYLRIKKWLDAPSPPDTERT